MWKKFMSSIGFGNVTVDTVLPKQTYKQGELLEGSVKVKGGAAEQDIERIELRLILIYEQDKEDSDFSYHEKELYEMALTNLHHVDSNELYSIPFSIPIDKTHPKTEAGVETVLRTKVLIHQGIDPEDEDKILIF